MNSPRGGFGQSSRVNELMSPDWPVATFYSVENLNSADILRVSQPLLTEDVCLKNKQNPCKQGVTGAIFSSPD